MAWLQAVPKPPAGSKRAAMQKSHGEGTSSHNSRMDRLRKQGIPPDLPPNPMPHIIARFIEIGMTENTGMGPVPLSWGELGEWQRQTGVVIAPWEAKLYRKLSIAFIAEGRRAEDENCPPPWHGGVSQRERELEVAQLRMVLG